jgi:hypothetical protein
MATRVLPGSRPGRGAGAAHRGVDNLEAGGEPAVLGEPLPAEAPAPQRPPRNGTGPRIDVARAARRLRATDYTLLAFAGADGIPVIVPVTVGSDDAGGISLTSAVKLPEGSRPTGLLGHSFRLQLIGLVTRLHTGWLDVSATAGARCAPHTETDYRGRRTRRCCCSSRVRWPNAGCGVAAAEVRDRVRAHGAPSESATSTKPLSARGSSMNTTAATFASVSMSDM